MTPAAITPTPQACASCGWPTAPHSLTCAAHSGITLQLCDVCALPGSPFSAPLLGGRDVRATDVLRGLAWALNIMDAAADGAQEAGT